MKVTAHEVASRLQGEKEIPGTEHNPLIEYMVRMDAPWFEGDETPWCSGFVNFVAKLLGLPRTESLRARSWLRVGTRVPLHEARRGFDVVVLKRGRGVQPGPDVYDAPGHVGFFDDLVGNYVYLLGGNQADSINVSRYPVEDVLAVQRLYPLNGVCS